MEGRDLLDTSVVVDLPRLSAAALPAVPAICTISLAELSAGPLVTNDPALRAARQAQLQRIESVFDPLPFDLRSAALPGHHFLARGARVGDAPPRH